MAQLFEALVNAIDIEDIPTLKRKQVPQCARVSHCAVIFECDFTQLRPRGLGWKRFRSGGSACAVTEQEVLCRLLPLLPDTFYFPALPWTLPTPVQKSQPVLPERPANGPQ